MHDPALALWQRAIINAWITRSSGPADEDVCPLPGPPPLIQRFLFLAATQSPCAKSRRGAIVWKGDPAAWCFTGFNGPPAPFVCDRAAECRRDCPRVAVHAEISALLAVQRMPDGPTNLRGAEIAHLKVRDDAPVTSGPPSCPDCSKAILAAGLAGVWLLHEGDSDGSAGAHWVRYEADVFHALSLKAAGLHGAYDGDRPPTGWRGGV